MAPPKKMTLQEFFTDESYGGSWADDDIDIASISVPIEKNKKYGSYSSDPFSNISSQMTYNNHSFHSHHTYPRQSSLHDNGPPYIVKLLNLPLTSNESFVEDLFKSRYTPFVKFKIVVDPSSNILETHIIKKIAFVELKSFQELNKVLKWQDLYYKAGRKVFVEQADFNDFQNCISFNQEHEQEIQKIQDDFIAGKQQQHSQHPQYSRHGPQSDSHRYQPPSRSSNIATSPAKHPHPLHHTSISKRPSVTLDTPVAPPVASPPKNKPNPFGAAKPVDILAKQHEIEKKLITLNHTTIKTMGSMPDEDISEDTRKQQSAKSSPTLRRSSMNSFEDKTTSRRSSINILKRPPQSSIKPDTHHKKEAEESEESEEAKESSKLTPAPIPASVYPPKGNGMSLAELLSVQNGDSINSPSGGRNTPTSGKSSASKQNVVKPVILKKKVPLQPVIDLTVKESEYIRSEEENKKKEEQNSEEIKTESEPKKIDSSLSKTGLSDSKVNNTESIASKGNDSTSIASSLSAAGKEHNKEKYPKYNEKVSESLKEERPNFKKHLNDLVKKSHIPKEKRSNPHNYNQTYIKGRHTYTRRHNNNNSPSRTSSATSNGEKHKTLEDNKTGRKTSSVKVVDFDAIKSGMSPDSTSESTTLVSSAKSSTFVPTSTKIETLPKSSSRFDRSRSPAKSKNGTFNKDNKSESSIFSPKPFDSKKSANSKYTNLSDISRKPGNNSDSMSSKGGMNKEKPKSDKGKFAQIKNADDFRRISQKIDEHEQYSKNGFRLGLKDSKGSISNSPKVKLDETKSRPKSVDVNVQEKKVDEIASEGKPIEPKVVMRAEIKDDANAEADIDTKDVSKSVPTTKTVTTSGRGRGRGNHRGSSRGVLRGRARGGNRGVANFNLHYIRNKSEEL